MTTSYTILKILMGRQRRPKFLPQILIASFVFLQLTACKKFLQIDPPVDKVETDLVFSSDALATASVTGLYSKMTSNQTFFGSFPISFYTAFSADELQGMNVLAQRDEFRNNAVSIENGIISNNLWQRAYEYIYHTNACIEGIASATDLTDSVARQLTGEARFVRAFCYFYLVNLFGDVPLITGTNYKENSKVARTATTAVYGQIMQDLAAARDMLTAEYPSPGKLRPNKWAAEALLARVALYHKDWTNALNYSDEILQTGTYPLETNTTSVFLATSTEAIWHLKIPDALSPGNLAEAQNFIPSSASARPNVVLTQSLLDAFETGDVRKTTYATSRTVNGTTYWYPYKYKVRAPAVNATENITVLRSAEMYLIRAEAKAQLNRVPEAVDDVNAIRTRSQLLPVSNDITQDSCLRLIARERRLEMMVEWGHRWLDLKRTNTADSVLTALKGTKWQSTDVLYPIPNKEILQNALLVQNEGYQ